MWEKIEVGYIISASLTLRESGKCSTHVGGGADDKILLFLKFCQRIYKKWDFSGKKSLKNVKKEKIRKKVSKRGLCPYNGVKLKNKKST